VLLLRTKAEPCISSNEDEVREIEEPCGRFDMYKCMCMYSWLHMTRGHLSGHSSGGKCLGYGNTDVSKKPLRHAG